MLTNLPTTSYRSLTISDVNVVVIVLDCGLRAPMPTSSSRDALADCKKGREGRLISSTVDTRVALGMELFHENGAVMAASRLAVLHGGDDGRRRRVETGAQPAVRTTARWGKLSIELRDV